MRRRNQRTKADETLKKTDPQIGFKFTDPSSSRANSDLKRRRRVSFDDVDHRSPLNESQAGGSIDAKTSEFAFFKKLKSGFGHCSESSDSKPPNKVQKIPKTFESRVKPVEHAGTDCDDNGRSKSYSFSTPIHSARRGSCANLTQRDRGKDNGKSSSSFSRDKDTVPSGDILRSGSGGISEEKGNIFSVKRKKLHHLVKDTWFSEIPELTSNGHDLVSVLLTRLFPSTEETQPSRFSKERTDRVKRRTFVDSPGSKFLKRSHESYTEVDHSLQMDRDRLISWQGWLENNITASSRKTDDFPLSYRTRLITYPNAPSSSLTDNPWSSDYSSSHDLVTRELCPLPLLSHYTSGSFLLPTTNQASHFEHDELERYIIGDEDVVAANQELQTFHHTNSSDCLTRDYTYYHNHSNSPVDHCPLKVPGCEIVSFPFSSISNSNMLEASSPTQSDRFKSHNWIPFQFQSPQVWIDS
ncbi:hypothetical protein ISN45_Aa03g039420 [Arabidopsis thaliana x Arabidopsis arenosa]|uniref:Uncharacterized protein n=1 Tax=Arabidopsis thaliana x Arabidopsis arenosa TaxID=1240361 RepID=A0A8T2B4B9_9BRAS|nr:hypothetical protein ISN45_Aa03g039420 [Arabidopsis thaliana x Arabidopsis arenosa]